MKYTELKHGMLVRYGGGSTALALIDTPHAGGYHAVQCMGGRTYVTPERCILANVADRATWDSCAKWRVDTRDIPPILGPVNEPRNTLKAFSAVAVPSVSASFDADATLSRIRLQRAEFDACDYLCKANEACASVAVVDDDYPAARSRYEFALRKFLEACKANGRTL